MTSETTEKCGVCGDGCCNCGMCHSCMGDDCAHEAGALGIMGYQGVRIAAFIALLALAAWGFVAAASGIKEFRYIGTGINPTNTISVQGSGKVFAVADTATFSFTVTETAADVGAAQKLVTDKMDDIIAYLKDEAEVADRDVQTTDYSAYPKYEDVVCPVGELCPRSQKIVGYTVSSTVTAKVRETDAAGDVLANVGSRGVSYVSGLSFTVDDEELLQEKARSKAIAEAKAKAEKLAGELGVSLVRIVSYYDNRPGIYYAKTYGMGGDAAIMESAPAVSIELGENTIISEVTITYEIR